ncbi:cytochrome b561 [Sphingobium wenxiniae]|uniref:Cytochrome b561 n=1 Tax=Sphingobium wenxiniae (strain DSM 21828 / CGMCC 1.7748 / JZ-1) TaxID=595605 RepID=A0A562K1X0_SPHWJ|nr:cytochrome b [Sphingobium wenxiniae]MBB6193660.1 cytochrome b561 [Sphingobium wenxiniae]TWH89422.1 cytochrome b561 [Sphingobium wenxiniae]
MNPVDSRQRFSSLSIALHWVTVLLISAVYATILLRENYPKGTDIREGLKTWHFMLGLAVLALIVIRLMARLASRQPPITPEPSVWQALLASTTHFALYAFMVAMPVAGWVILSASGKTIPFFGLELPALVGQSKTLAAQVKKIHETVGTIGYLLIGLHALAGLYHHYVVKDDTLRRMLPGRH